jgi:excisionase family DNA binding protein
MRKQTETTDFPWITAAETAKILGVTPRRVRQLCASGKFESARLVQGWLIDRNEVNRFNEVPRVVGRPQKK